MTYVIQLLQNYEEIISTHNYLLMKVEQTECSERSAYKFQTPGNYQKKAYEYWEIIILYSIHFQFNNYGKIIIGSSISTIR